MKQQLAGWLTCPATGEELTLRVEQEQDGEILEGELVSKSDSVISDHAWSSTDASARVN